MAADAERLALRHSLSIASPVKAYFELIKPERTLVNVLSAAAGFLLASRWDFSASLLVFALLGTALVIASGCVSNNLLDRKIDRKMNRTSHRVLVTGTVSVPRAAALAGVLGLVGLGLLALTNWLTFGLGVLAYVSYVFVYGWAKRYTPWSTLIGTLPGGLSIVAGYCAVTDRIGLTGIMLFLALLSWQMAHFYAIAVYRRSDYSAAKLPIWSVKNGIASTRRQVIAYELAFLVVSLALAWLVDSWLLAVVSVLLSMWWLRVSLSRDKGWARSSFSASLSVMLIFCFALALSPLV